MSEQTKTTKKTIALQNFDNSISSLVEGSSNNDSLLKEEKNEQKIEIQRISSSLEESPKQIKSKIYNLAVTKSQDQVEPETPSSPSKNSPTLKKMFGVLGNFGNGLKKNLTSIRSKSRSSMAINLKKIQEKLNFLRLKNEFIKDKKN